MCELIECRFSKFLQINCPKPLPHFLALMSSIPRARRSGRMPTWIELLELSIVALVVSETPHQRMSTCCAHKGITWTYIYIYIFFIIHID